MRDQAGAVEFVGSFTSEWPDVGLPEVAFAGRSNVGKSSALNTLLRSRKAARVSGRPGRTQAINLFRVGKACVFADLPGYGFAKVPDHVQAEWKGIIERYLGDRDTLKAVVVLVDARREPQDMDVALIEGLVDAEIPVILVATKVDKLKRSQRDKHLGALERGHGVAPIPFSSVTREGYDIVWDAIETACRAP